MREIWLRREIEGSEGKILIENGYLPINFLEYSEYADKICDMKLNFKGINMPRFNGKACLERFCREMKEGDWVIVRAYPKRGEFSVFELTGKSAKHISKMNDSAISEKLQGKPKTKVGFYREASLVMYGVSKHSLRGLLQSKYSFDEIYLKAVALR